MPSGWDNTASSIRVRDARTSPHPGSRRRGSAYWWGMLPWRCTWSSRSASTASRSPTMAVNCSSWSARATRVSSAGFEPVSHEVPVPCQLVQPATHETIGFLQGADPRPEVAASSLAKRTDYLREARPIQRFPPPLGQLTIDDWRLPPDRTPVARPSWRTGWSSLGRPLAGLGVALRGPRGTREGLGKRFRHERPPGRGVPDPGRRDDLAARRRSQPDRPRGPDRRRRRLAHDPDDRQGSGEGERLVPAPGSRRWPRISTARSRPSAPARWAARPTRVHAGRAGPAP